MWWKKTLLFNTAQLPAYWRAGRKISRTMSYRGSHHVYGPDARQYFLLLEPEDREVTEDLPWAFYLHGGAWTFGRPEQFLYAAIPWLQRGFRVVLPSYRRPPRSGLTDITTDVGEAAGAVFSLARRSGRPVTSAPQLAGISAGGHLAAWLALHPGVWTSRGWPAPPERAVCFAAPLDLTLLRPRTLFRPYDALSPTSIVRERPVAVDWLLVHGTHDGMVDYQHSRNFLEAVTDGGGNGRLLTLTGGTHLDAGRWAHGTDDRVGKEVGLFIGE